MTRLDGAGGVEAEGGGLRLRGRTRHPLPVGAAAVATIRPDDVRLGHEPPGVNAFPGKVEIVEYLGREDEVVLALAAGPRLWIRTPERVTTGEAVTASFPPERVIMLPPEAAA